MSDTPSPTPPQPPARKLKIDLAELASAFENASWENACVLDRETGQVIQITVDTRVEYDRLVEALDDVDEADWPAAFEAALAEADLPDWQHELVREADQVEAGLDERYIRVPQADSHEGYADMENFIETVTNERLADRLARAIQGRGAFRRFKDTLFDDPGERERWFAFRDARQRERVLEWLESEGIEAG